VNLQPVRMQVQEDVPPLRVRPVRQRGVQCSTLLGNR
jgi:hypothetical protein